MITPSLLTPNRTRRLVRWGAVALLVSLFVGLPRGFAEPRDYFTLESRIPSSSLGIVTIEDVGGMEARMEKTAIAGLFREPEMKAFFEPIEKAGTEMLDAGEEGPFGEAGPMIVKVLEQLKGLRGQIAVAILDYDQTKDMPSAVASLDFGPNVSDFVTFLQTLRAEFDPEGNTVREFEKDGKIWWEFKEGPPITGTTVDTAFVMATDATVLAGVIAGVGEKHLGSDGNFQAVRAKAGGENLAVFAYANVPAIVNVFAADADAEGMRIANHLGLDTLKGAAYAMAFAGDGFMDSFILHTPGADHGIVPLVSTPEFTAPAAPFAPSNAFYLADGAMNIDGLLPRIRTLIEGIEEGASEELDEGLQHVDEAIGVSLEKDLLAGLTGAVGAYASMPDTGGLYPEFSYLLQVKDRASFEAVMEKAVKGIAGMATEEGGMIASTRTLDYHGHKLHLVELQGGEGRDVIPFTPTWTMLDSDQGSWCAITLVPHAMKEIILRHEGKEKGLTSEEDYLSVRRVMPSSAGAMTYIDLQAILNLIYDTAVPALQTAAKPNLLGNEMPFTLDWALLPAARTVRPYFRSMGVFTTWNKDGIAVQMHGPLPLMGAMIIGAGVGATYFMARATAMPPSTMRMRPEPRGPMKGQPIRPRQPGSAKGRLAQIQAQQVASYVRVFVLTQKRLPTNLSELVSEDIAASVPTDPWGNDYAINVIDAKSKRFKIVSAGPDGIFGNADDVQTGG